MRAVLYERQGPAAEVLSLRELPVPRPGPGELLVRVAASGVNPSDVRARAGARGPMGFARIVPHSDGAGVVEALGEGVATHRPGDRVWLWNAAWGRADGTAADYVALPAAQAVRLPDRAALWEGACLGIPALTAHACVLGDGPVAGARLLVSGGGGTVGAYAVAMARLAGARVVATAGSEASRARAHEAGAQAVVDRRDPEAARLAVAALGGPADRIVEVEFGANLPLIREALAPNGTVAAYGSAAAPEPPLPFYPLMFRGATLRLVLVYILPPAARARALRDLTRWLAQGALPHRVAARLPLGRTAEAHELVEAGGRVGSVLVEPDPELAARG
jgi:NADPH:quinone reductase-like Zn-dependent oxidoreductase